MEEAKNYMNKPITINNSAKISDVIKKILKLKISRLLVTKDNIITEIVSEKDLGLLLFMDKTERALGDIPVSEI